MLEYVLYKPTLLEGFSQLKSLLIEGIVTYLIMFN
jgi:hypothetical protein